MAVKGRKGRNTRKSLQKSLNHSYKHKDDGSGSSIIKIPKGISFFPKLKTDTKYRLGFVCYPIGSKKHPLVRFSGFEVGEYVYNLEVIVHRNVGVSGKRIICLKEMFNKKCPVCEEMNTMKNEGNVEGAESLKTTRRVFYLVIDFKNLEKGLQVIEQSHYTFEKPLITSARGSSDTPGEIIEFPIDPEDGSGNMVRFEMFEKSGGGFSFLEPGGIQFKEIKEELSKDIFKDIFSLDECLVIPSEEEVKALLYGNDIEEEEELSKEDSTQEKEEKNSEEKECPCGHNFGSDCDFYEDDCDDCDIWGRCNKASKEV